MSVKGGREAVFERTFVSSGEEWERMGVWRSVRRKRLKWVESGIYRKDIRGVRREGRGVVEC